MIWRLMAIIIILQIVRQQNPMAFSQFINMIDVKFSLLWYGLRHMHVQGIKFVWLAELKLTEEGQTSAFLWRI